MAGKAKPMKQFRLSIDTLKKAKADTAYGDWVETRDAYNKARNALDDAKQALENRLDAAAYLVGKSFKFDKEPGYLIVECYAEAPQRGKRKAEIEEVTAPFSGAVSPKASEPPPSAFPKRTAKRKEATE